MDDPFQILGVEESASAEQIRERYLALTREFPPDRHPEKFAKIRRAYEVIRDEETRLRRALFTPAPLEDLEAILREVQERMGRRRFSLSELMGR